MTRNTLNQGPKRDVSPLGRKLHQLIRAANYDYIKDFEKESGVRPDSIRRVIGGYTKSLPFSDLQKVATTLKISVQELMTGSADGEAIATCNLVPGAKEPCWYQVHSDEMSPTLKSGDNVLVDTGIRTVVEAGIYLLGTPSSTAFRRISHNPVTGKLRVEADNKTYSYVEEVDPEKLSVRGRVIGIFHRI